MTPSSDNSGDTAAVKRFLKDSGAIANGDATMSLVEMHAHLRGRIMRYQKQFNI